jgi:hypothetical protein
MRFAKVQEEWNENGHGTEVPADLATQIRDPLTQDAKLSWDDA